jgi:cell division protein FtsL
MSEHTPARRRLAGARPRGTTLLVVIGCGALLTLGALFFVWQRYQFIRLGFEVGALRQRQAELQERIEPLEVEAEYLARPERIEAIARERLGMRPPSPSQVIVIEPPREPAR